MEAFCKHCNLIFKRQYKAQIYCSLLCANRSNLNKKNFVTLPQRLSIELAEFIGILLGDGQVCDYYAQISLNAIADKDYVPHVVSLSKKLFPGASVTNRPRTDEGIIPVQISAKDVCDYLKSIDFHPKIKHIPSWIFQEDKYKKAAIRGLFDTEGSVGIKYFNGKNGKYFYKQLTFTNKNKYILKFVEETLVSLGYRATKNSVKNIYISNRLQIKRYLEEIGASNPKLIAKIKARDMNGFHYGGVPEQV